MNRKALLLGALAIGSIGLASCGETKSSEYLTMFNCVHGSEVYQDDTLKNVYYVSISFINNTEDKTLTILASDLKAIEKDSGTTYTSLYFVDKTSISSITYQGETKTVTEYTYKTSTDVTVEYAQNIFIVFDVPSWEKVYTFTYKDAKIATSTDTPRESA